MMYMYKIQLSCLLFSIASYWHNCIVLIVLQRSVTTTFTVYKLRVADNFRTAPVKITFNMFCKSVWNSGTSGKSLDLTLKNSESYWLF